MQQVGVHGVGRWAFAFGTVHGDAVLIGVAHELFTREQIPFTPRRDDFHIRHQGISAQLETHLVIAFACRSVADGVSLGFAGNFHQALGNQGAGDGGAQEVLALVKCIGTEHGEHKVAHKLFAQIFNKNIAGLDAHFDGLEASRLDFFALANVSGKGDDFAVVFVLQPLQDDGGVQATRVGEHDALRGMGFAGNRHRAGLVGQSGDSRPPHDPSKAGGR